MIMMAVRTVFCAKELWKLTQLSWVSEVFDATFTTWPEIVWKSCLIQLRDPYWTSLIHFGRVCSNLDMSDPFRTSLIHFGQV